MPYTIQSGDNLWNIWLAQGQDVSWDAFLALNSQFANPDLIYPGQTVNLPGDAAAAAAAKAASKPAAKAPAAPKPSAVGPVPVAPGITAKQWAAMLAEQNRAAEAQEELLRQAQEDARRALEAQLGANPADYVAYELYKRSLIEQGYTPEGTVKTDEEIQAEVAAALSLNAGTSAGTGQFGVNIPSTQSISRSELLGFSATDIDILSSFLRGGVDIGEDGYSGIDPAGFFKELEEGLVPVLPGQRTQFVY